MRFPSTSSVVYIMTYNLTLKRRREKKELPQLIPKHLRRAHHISLNLSNPDRPELQLPAPPAPKQAKTEP